MKYLVECFYLDRLAPINEQETAVSAKLIADVDLVNYMTGERQRVSKKYKTDVVWFITYPQRSVD